MIAIPCVLYVEVNGDLKKAVELAEEIDKNRIRIMFRGIRGELVPDLEQDPWVYESYQNQNDFRQRPLGFGPPRKIE